MCCFSIARLSAHCVSVSPQYRPPTSLMLNVPSGLQLQASSRMHHWQMLAPLAAAHCPARHFGPYASPTNLLVPLLTSEPPPGVGACRRPPERIVGRCVRLLPLRAVPRRSASAASCKHLAGLRGPHPQGGHDCGGRHQPVWRPVGCSAGGAAGRDTWGVYDKE